MEKSSLCNCVVNFLLEENYLLTAFELLHELLDDGRDDQAIRLKNFFSDSSQFPPDQISRFNTLRGTCFYFFPQSTTVGFISTDALAAFVFCHDAVADPQTLLQENEAVEEKLAITEYELRLAQEDISKFKTELQKQAESPVTELRGNL